MTDYDPSRDEDTKVIAIPVTETPVEKASEPVKRLTNVVVLPDGTKPVKMGSGFVTGILGEGGMAIVYEIWNEQLGVKRAVKLLRPNSTLENVERFRKEIKVTAQLDHPNIIDIHSVGEWNGLPFIEMEMVDGISLSELIKRQGALPLEVATAIAIIVCRGLDYTHHHVYTVNKQKYTGLLHRDLKPGNILFSREGIVRLTDFGVATPTDVAPSTSSGKVIGSMMYLAPEQLEEDEVDTRADIFSVGCILYEMLTGERTFPDRNITRLVRKRLKNDFRPLSSFPISIPSRLENQINECLQLNVTKRPDDIRNVLHELEKVHKSISAKSPEEVITAYARGEDVEEEDLFLKQKRFPTIKIAGIALLTFSVVAFCVYLYTHFPWVNNVEEEQVSNTVFFKEDKKALQKNRVKKIRSPRPELVRPTSPNAESVVRKKRVRETPATIRKPMKTSPGISRKRPAKVVRPQRKTESPPAGGEKEPKTLLNTLKKKYKTNDFITVMKAEISAKNYDNVFEIYQSLPREQASQKETRLLRHRALVETNKVNKSYFDNNHINDGEFYLSKAQFLYRTKQYQRSIWILGIITSAPAELVNKKMLHKDVLYYQAKCHNGIFEIKRTPEKQKTALQSWFNVKNEFRSNQNHPYFLEANQEIRRISKVKIE